MKKSIVVVVFIAIIFLFYLKFHAENGGPVIAKIDLCTEDSKSGPFIGNIDGLSVYVGILSEDFMTKLSRSDRNRINISGMLQIEDESGVLVFSEEFKQTEISSNVSRTIAGTKYHLQLINVGLVKNNSSGSKTYRAKLSSKCNKQELKNINSYVFIEGYNPKI